MYSLVLMAAMTTTPATPACHWGKGGGCYGGGGSCYGSYACYGCYGCTGGYGGYAGYGYGGGCSGCMGYGYPGLAGSYPGTFGCFGGGYGTGSAYGPVHAPVQPGALPPRPEQLPPPKPEPGASRTSINNQAKLVIELPGDAKLYIDDHLMKAASGQRIFRTPSLDKGQAYYYILRAEVDRDGKTQTATKRVIVRAGEEVKASFAELRLPVETTAVADSK